LIAVSSLGSPSVVTAGFEGSLEVDTPDKEMLADWDCKSLVAGADLFLELGDLGSRKSAVADLVERRSPRIYL